MSFFGLWWPSELKFQEENRKWKRVKTNFKDLGFSLSWFNETWEDGVVSLKITLV